MIIGAHTILYSTDAEADRAFLRDVLGLPSVDAGHGWLIFALPPAEAAVHPADKNDVHELFLITDDLPGEMARLEKVGGACEPVTEQRWGRLTGLRLPGGGKLGLYEPRHPLAIEV
jgi:hypothetical protein